MELFDFGEDARLLFGLHRWATFLPTGEDVFVMECKVGIWYISSRITGRMTDLPFGTQYRLLKETRVYSRRCVLWGCNKLNAEGKLVCESCTDAVGQEVRVHVARVWLIGRLPVSNDAAGVIAGAYYASLCFFEVACLWRAGA
jgi:hypothetical protein